MAQNNTLHTAEIVQKQKKELSRFKKLDKVMYDNLKVNLADLANSVHMIPFHKQLNFYCYLLAMLRAVIDFSDIAYAQHASKLSYELDQLYQVVQSMVVYRSSQRLPWLHWDAPLIKRLDVGKIADYIKQIEPLAVPQTDRRLQSGTKKRRRSFKKSAQTK